MGDNPGDALGILRSLDAHDQYNLTIIEPTFTIDPWYADNPTDPGGLPRRGVAAIWPRAAYLTRRLRQRSGGCSDCSGWAAPPWPSPHLCPSAAGNWYRFIIGAVAGCRG